MKRNARMLCLELGAAILTLTAGTAMAVQAAEGFDPRDTTLTIGGNTYTFPDTVEHLQEAGLEFNVPGGASSDKYYMVDAKDANEVRFILYVEKCDGDMYATGFRVKASDAEDAIAGGVALDDTKAKTLKKQLESLEKQEGYQNIEIEKDEYTVFTLNINQQWSFDIDGKHISEVYFKESLLSSYGTEYTNAGATTSEVPEDLSDDEFVLNGVRYDINSTIQDLLDNGWKMTAADLKEAESALQPNHYTLGGIYLYNGDSMICAGAFNTTPQIKTILGSSIGSIEVRKEWNSDIHFANGLTLGSSVKDFESAYGKPSDDTFKLESGQKFTVAYAKDKSVYGIEMEKR